mgnify:FL=1|jgi:hypothetical protein
MLEDMDAQVAKLRKELLTMCWYMRGGLTYEESVFLNQVDRQAIAELIESNLKTTKDSQLPFF